MDVNYFEFYDLPVSFHPDKEKLKAKFYELSKKYHPDRHANEPAEKQEEVLEFSTINNKAFKTLSNTNLLIPYVLGQYSLISEGDKYQLPQNFLMEMMDVNESLMELEFEPDASKQVEITRQVSAVEADLFAELNVLTNAFEEAGAQERKDILLKIRDIWYRQKYLLRIRESLNKFAARL